MLLRAVRAHGGSPRICRGRESLGQRLLEDALLCQSAACLTGTCANMARAVLRGASRVCHQQGHLYGSPNANSATVAMSVQLGFKLLWLGMGEGRQS